MSTAGADERASAPGRIALRSPLEAFLWLFITRLIAMVTATRVPRAPDDAAGSASSATDASATADPARARRVAASRPPIAGERTTIDPNGAARTASDTATRAVVVTATASVVAGAAAFAAGRRRGRR